MKKRSCKMSDEEKNIHDFAVKVRKMTDKQLYDFINANTEEENTVDDFIKNLEEHSISGIGPAITKKLKDFAIEKGYIKKD